MNTERTAATRLLAPIAVMAVAAIVLFVIATSLGGSDEDNGRRGDGSGSRAAKKTDEKFYTVEPGDSLSTIADKVGVPVDRLSALNPDLDPQALISGQRVKLR